MGHEGTASGACSTTPRLWALGKFAFPLSVLSFLTCDVGTGSTSTSQDSCEGGFGSLLAVDGLERRLAQRHTVSKRGMKLTQTS